MTKRMEQTQNAKMVQLALFREYGFQPSLKDIKILNTRDFDEFPGHVEALYTVIKPHEPLPGIKRGTTGNLSVRNQHRLSAVS